MPRKDVDCNNCGKRFSSYNANPKFCSLSCRSEGTKHKVPFGKVVEMYERGMTQSEIADVLGTTQKVIWKRMKENGYEARVAAKRDQRGEKNDSWKGGRTKDSRGYVLVKVQGHPRAKTAGDYVFEHIIVAESHIGRYLGPSEIIHHINGVKDDNRPENLYITNPSEHSSVHNNGWAHRVESNLNTYKGAC